MSDDKHIEPVRVLFLECPVTWNDGTLMHSLGDGHYLHDTLNEAIRNGLDYANEYCGETYIYRCIPIRVIRRGAAVVRDISKRNFK